MPIEIKELHIKAVVGKNNSEAASQGLKAEDISRLKKELSKEIIEKVFRVIRQKNER